MVEPPRRGWRRLSSGRHAASLLRRPWVLAVAASGVGAALALAVFFGLGFRAEPGPQGVEVPPQAASSEPEVAVSAPSEAEPNTPAEAATPESKPDASPFAGIAEPPPEPPKRTA